jgi:hypothetical protein
MKRIYPFLMVFVLFSSSIAGARSADSLSADEIVRLARESRQRQKEYVKDYTCICVEEMRILDKKGKIKHKEIAEKRVYVKGELTHDQIVRIEKKEKSLPEKEIKKRQKEIDKEEKKRAKEKESEWISPFDKDAEGKFDFALVREDSLHGKSVYVLSANPRKKGKGLLKGLHWIDKESFRVWKSELAPSKNPKFVKEMKIFMDFARVEQGVFLIKTFRVKGRGGFLFFKTNFEMERSCRDYRLNVGLEDEVFPELEVE